MTDGEEQSSFALSEMKQRKKRDQFATPTEGDEKLADHRSGRFLTIERLRSREGAC